MNYTEKETVSLNANAISNVIPTIHANLNKIESRLEEINSRVEYINMSMNHITILNHISSFHTLPDIPLKNKTKSEKSSPPLLSYTLLLNDILIYNRNLIYRISILKTDMGIIPPKTKKNQKTISIISFIYTSIHNLYTQSIISLILSISISEVYSKY